MGGWNGKDYTRIAIDPALPCSVARCGHPANHAVAERDDAYPELWRLLPVCDSCAQRLAISDHGLQYGSNADLLAMPR